MDDLLRQQALERIRARGWSYGGKTSMSACVEWRGCRVLRGYGQRHRRGERERYAHRVAWIETHGVIPDGMFVLHHCDNPACVNVGHLFLGTHTDNMQDMMNKGRSLKAERNHQAKLNQPAVERMRAWRYEGLTYRAIAVLFNVTVATAFNAVTGKSWAGPNKVLGKLAALTTRRSPAGFRVIRQIIRRFRLWTTR